MRRTLSTHLNKKAETASVESKLLRLVHLVRKHLNMQVAFIAKFENGRRIFQSIDSSLQQCPISIGQYDLEEDTYCRKIADNNLDPIINDTNKNDITKNMGVTKALNIGSYIGLPIILSSGKVYGTFCCFSDKHDDSLNDRDISYLGLIAEIAGELIEERELKQQVYLDHKYEIEQIIKTNNICMYFQPIFCLQTNRIKGFESLSRFFTQPYKTPDIWFKSAAKVGLGEALEVLALQNVIHSLEYFCKDTYISINTSPEHIMSGVLFKKLAHIDCSNIVIEITEHSPIYDYQVMRDCLKPLREKGIRLAIDDVGAGYSSFQHILELEADIIKLDISLTQNINKDRTKFLLAKALLGFANAINCTVIAEGIENKHELTTLKELGINNIQGYFIGKPAPLFDSLALLNKGIRFD